MGIPSKTLTADIFIGEGEKADAATTVEARMIAVVFMVAYFWIRKWCIIRRDTLCTSTDRLIIPITFMLSGLPHHFVIADYLLD